MAQTTPVDVNSVAASVASVSITQPSPPNVAVFRGSPEDIARILDWVASTFAGSPNRVHVRTVHDEFANSYDNTTPTLVKGTPVIFHFRTTEPSHVSHCDECSTHLASSYQRLCNTAGPLQDQYAKLLKKHEPEEFARLAKERGEECDSGSDSDD